MKKQDNIFKNLKTLAQLGLINKTGLFQDVIFLRLLLNKKYGFSIARLK
jgi:hypothetical protein